MGPLFLSQECVSCSLFQGERERGMSSMFWGSSHDPVALHSSCPKLRVRKGDFGSVDENYRKSSPFVLKFGLSRFSFLPMGRK